MTEVTVYIPNSKFCSDKHHFVMGFITYVRLTIYEIKLSIKKMKKIS